MEKEQEEELLRNAAEHSEEQGKPVKAEGTQEGEEIEVEVRNPS